MNTFLPYPDFNKSVQCLDRKRLGKQRVEAYQILRVLTVKQKSKGWKNHPAVLMWKGYEAALARYATCACIEWQNRGYLDTVLFKIYKEFPELITDSFKNPPWLGDDRFHSSHKSNLLRKNDSWYKQFGWEISPDLAYVWPVRKAITVGELHGMVPPSGITTLSLEDRDMRFDSSTHDQKELI